jgi:hypothetical protein
MSLKDTFDKWGDELNKIGRKVDHWLDDTIPVVAKAKDLMKLTPLAPWAVYVELALSVMQTIEKVTPELIVEQGAVSTGDGKKEWAATTIREGLAINGLPMPSHEETLDLVQVVFDAAKSLSK